jgi:hypothetical protein
MWRKQIGESSCNFGGDSRPDCTPLCQKNGEIMQIQGQIE